MLFLSESPQIIQLSDAQLIYFPDVFPIQVANECLDYCLHELPWRQDHLTIARRRIPLPRLQNWFGDPDARYSYSGLTLEPMPWTAELLRIKTRVEAISEYLFNSALANLYRDGTDSVGWHSDDEKELGEQPVIASVSFGATRNFEMRRKSKDKTKTLKLPLHHGSVLLMRGSTQKYWRHQLPKDPTIAAARVNLTFRKIMNTPAHSH